MTHNRPLQLRRVLSRLGAIGFGTDHIVVAHSLGTVDNQVEPDKVLNWLRDDGAAQISGADGYDCEGCNCQSKKQTVSQLSQISYICTPSLPWPLGRAGAKIESTRNLIAGVAAAFAPVESAEASNAADNAQCGALVTIKGNPASNPPGFVLIIEDDATLSPDLGGVMASARVSAISIADRLHEAMGWRSNAVTSDFESINEDRSVRKGRRMAARPGKIASGRSVRNRFGPRESTLSKGQDEKGRVDFNAGGMPWLRMSQLSLTRLGGAAEAAVARGEADSIRSAVLALLGVASGTHLARPSLVAGLSDVPAPLAQIQIDREAGIARTKASAPSGSESESPLLDPSCQEPLDRVGAGGNNPIPIELVALEGQPRLVVKTWAWQTSREAWDGWLRGDLERSVAAAVGARWVAAAIRSTVSWQVREFMPRSISVGFEAGAYYQLLAAFERSDFRFSGLPRARQPQSRAEQRKRNSRTYWTRRRAHRTAVQSQDQPPIDRCLHCEPACYDHVVEHGLQSRGGFLLAPRLPRVSQMPGSGMTYDRNPTPALVRFAGDGGHQALGQQTPSKASAEQEFALVDSSASSGWWAFGWFRTPGHSQLAPRWKSVTYAYSAIQARAWGPGRSLARLEHLLRASDRPGKDGRRGPDAATAALVTLWQHIGEKRDASQFEGVGAVPRPQDRLETESGSGVGVGEGTVVAADGHQAGASGEEPISVLCALDRISGSPESCESLATEAAYALAGMAMAYDPELKSMGARRSQPVDADWWRLVGLDLPARGRGKASDRAHPLRFRSDAGSPAGGRDPEPEMPDAVDADLLRQAGVELGGWELAAWWEWADADLSTRRDITALLCTEDDGTCLDLDRAVMTMQLQRARYSGMVAEGFVWLQLARREPLLVAALAVLLLCLVPVACAFGVPLAFSAGHFGGGLMPALGRPLQRPAGEGEGEGEGRRGCGSAQYQRHGQMQGQEMGVQERGWHERSQQQQQQQQQQHAQGASRKNVRNEIAAGARAGLLSARPRLSLSSHDAEGSDRAVGRGVRRRGGVPEQPFEHRMD